MSGIGLLSDALATERRLLDDLARVLVHQRAAVSGEDLEAIGEATFASYRVLRTLREATRRRRSIVRLLCADEEVQLHELDSVLGSLTTADLGARLTELLAAAARLAGEVDLNRRVVDGALETDEQGSCAVTG